MNSVFSRFRTGNFGRVLDALKRAHPWVYWQARNRVALAELYLLRSVPAAWRGLFPNYGADYYEFHEYGDWDGLARVIYQHLRPKSVLDVGCGQGLILAAFRQCDPGVTLTGVDYSAAALEKARARGLATRQLDLMIATPATVTRFGSDVGIVDLSLCLEVAEHLPDCHTPKLLTLLTRTADLVVFSAAHPNQGGFLHVNERPVADWVARFHRLGFELAPEDQPLRDQLQHLKIPWYYQHNLRVFRRAAGRRTR